MTNGRRPTGLVLGTLKAVTLAVVSGCSTAAVPAGPVEQPSESPASAASPRLHASGKAYSGTNNDFVEGANDSDAAEEPTFTKAELSDQVERVTREFMAESLARGYPHKNDKALLRRIEQLTTPDAARQQQQILDKDESPKDLYARHDRTLAQVDSVTSVIIASGKARAKVEFRLVTDGYKSGKWRAVKTGQPQEQTFELVHRAGEGWLISSIS